MRFLSRIKIFIALLFTAYILSAQPELHERVDSLLGLADKFKYSESEQKLPLASEALLLAAQGRYSEGKAQAEGMIALTYYWNLQYDSAFVYFKSAFHNFSRLKDTSNAASQLANIGNIFSRKGNIDSSIIYHKRAYNLFLRAGDKKRASSQITSIGLRNMWKGAYRQAEESFAESLSLRNQVKDSAAIAAIYNNFGVLYWRWGKLKSAMNMYEKAMDLRRILKKPKGMIYPKLNVGLILIDLMDYNYAEEYLLDGLRLAEETDYPNGVAVAYLYLTELYLEMGDYVNTDIYAHKTINKCDEVNSPLGKVKATNLLAKGYIEQGKFNEAKSILIESLDYIKDYKRMQIITDLHYSLAYLEFKRKNYRKSENYIEQALSGAETTVNAKRDINLLAAKIYKQLGHYKKSSEQFIKYSILADSLYNKQVIEVVSNWRKKYNATQQENEILKLKELSLVQDAEIAQQKNIRNIFIISLISVIIILLLLWTLYRHKHKLVYEIENQKEKLAQSNESKLKLFSIISHDLRNPFMTLLGLTGELKKNHDKMTNEDTKSSIEIIDTSANKLSRLSQNLLAWARLNTDGITVRPENNDIRELVNQAAKEFLEQASKKNIAVTVNLKETHKCYCDGDMIAAVLRNLLNNAIKYSYNGSEVEISAFRTDENVEVKVRDNGVGISKEVREQLFSSTKFYSTAGTASEKGSGLGLKISHEFAKLNGGELTLADNSEKGSTFILSLKAVSQ